MVAGIAALYVSILLFPQPFFRHKQKFQEFTVYSDAELPADLDAVVRDVEERVRAMELYRGGEHYRVFLCHSQKLYAFFATLARRRADNQGLVFSLIGNMILSEPGMRAMRERTGGARPHARFEGGLAGSIAHEVAHIHMTEELGYRRLRALPFWIAEGYAEYAAYRTTTRSDPAYRLPDRIRLVLDDESWLPPYRPADRRHFRWQLLVTFLCDVRELRFADLAGGSITEESAWNEMLAWLAEQELEGGAGPSS